MELVKIDDLPQVTTINDTDRIIVNQTQTSRANLSKVKTYMQGDLPQKIEDTKTEVKGYVDQLLSGRNEWLPPVNTAAQLRTTGLDPKTNYLCKVVADPVKSGVYQRVAGAGAWVLFDATVDFVNEQELASGISGHNTDNAAHPDIRQAITQEAADRGSAIIAHNTSAASHADIRGIINNHVGIPEWDAGNFTLTFTAESGATLIVDIPLESLGGSFDFDPLTNELVIIRADGTEARVSLADLIAEYEGSTGDHIQITVDSGNVIRAALLSGSIAETDMSSALAAKINRLGNVTNDAQVRRAEMGVAGGVATLDGAGKVPASQLPEDSGGGVELNRTVTGDDNAAGTVTDTGGNLSIPVPVTVAAPAASDAQITQGTRPLRAALQILIDNIAHLFANKVDKINITPVASPAAKKVAYNAQGQIASSADLTALDLGRGYGTCATAAATAAKDGILADFVRSAGAVAGIKFTYANTAASPVLNVNSTGAAAIVDCMTGAAPVAGAMGAAVHLFQFDGTNWVLLNPATVPTPQLPS